MSIGKRFRLVSWAAAGLIIALGIAIGLTSINQGGLNHAQEIRYDSYRRANELRMSSEDLTRLARTYVVTGDPKYEQQYWDILAVRNGKKERPDGSIASLRSIMEKLGFTDEEFAKLKEAEDNSNSLVHTETVAMNAVKGLYDDGHGNFTLRRAPDFEMARRIMHDEKYHQDKARIMKPINEFEGMLDHRTEDAVRSYVLRGNLLLGLIALLAFGTAAAIFYLVQSSKVVLRQIVTQLNRVTEKAANLTDDMLKTSQQLSTVSHEQAAGVQGTVSGLNEINAMAGQTLENEMIGAIQDIDRSNQAIFEQVGEGNRQLEEIVRIIQSITEKTKVINDIVFQTKLLSFNASVEAARAGENGKGFAVVAEEVGSLAQMSGSSAKEISTMLDDSIQRVESIIKATSTRIETLVGQAKSKVQHGTEVAQKCDGTLNQVVEIVSKVDSFTKEITKASEEQANGVNHITQAMQNIEIATNQSAEMANQTASCATDLETSTKELRTLVATIEADIFGINSFNSPRSPSSSSRRAC